MKQNDLQVVLPPQLVDKAPSPRFLGTHMHPDNIPATFYQKKVKVSLFLWFLTFSCGAAVGSKV